MDRDENLPMVGYSWKNLTFTFILSRNILVQFAPYSITFFNALKMILCTKKLLLKPGKIIFPYNEGISNIL